MITKLNVFLGKFVGPNGAHTIDALIALALVGAATLAVSGPSRLFLLHHATLGVIVTTAVPVVTALASKFRKASGSSAPLADQVAAAVTQALKDAGVVKMLVVGAVLAAAAATLGQTAAAATSCHARAGGALPDAVCTPGVTNPKVTQANIGSTICVKGWTATIRPPASYTTALKKKQMLAYGLPGSTSLYEEDHLISLELGGNPTDPHNLWPEPWNGAGGAHAKDLVENRLKAEVCSGKLTLAAAQKAISTDWRKAP